MADLHKAFGIFHDRVALTAGKKVTLRMARNAIRERIRRYFRSVLQLQAPKFLAQGSYAMGTMVNPIDNEYDIDDGVYLQHLDHRDDRKWPAAATVHHWLVKAAHGLPGEDPIDMRTCVRIRYAGQFHVDLPSYGDLNGQYLLADMGGTQWPPSDPLALTSWFKSQVNLHGEQLRRITRYLKAWADFQSIRRGKMPGGLILTVLAANHFHGQDRDDLAFANTIQAISHAVRNTFFVLNPVDIYEELTGRLTDTQKTRFQNAIQAAATDANRSITVDDDRSASKLWRRQLGDRFPIAEKKEKSELGVRTKIERS